ncbi:hypothetical protein K170097C1_29010 [Hungatella effluvii]
MVDAGHCIQKDKTHYRMLDKSGRQVHYLKGTKVMVIQAFDGQLFCIVNENTVLVLEEVPEYEKTSRAFAPEIPREKPKKRYIPPMSHPWRRSTFIRFAQKQPHRIEMELSANRY